MRLLGTEAALPVCRWDLVHLLASLRADSRPEIQALIPPVEAGLAEVKAERDALEDAEDAAIIAGANRKRRDEELDATVVEMGGVARTRHKEAYATFFPKHNPTRTAKMAMADEAREVERILGEMDALPADHPLRVEYQAPLAAGLTGLRAALTAEGQAATALSLARSRATRFKLRLDQARVEVHGRLLTILKDKDAANSFFRSSRKSPGTEPEGEQPAEAQEPAEG